MVSAYFNGICKVSRIAIWGCISIQTLVQLHNLGFGVISEVYMIVVGVVADVGEANRKKF